MEVNGLMIKGSEGSKRIHLKCEHQNGVLYVVPAEASWVCNEDLLHAHSIAGFFDDIVDLDDKNIQQIMQKWGIYYPTSGDLQLVSLPEHFGHPQIEYSDGIVP